MEFQLQSSVKLSEPVGLAFCPTAQILATGGMQLRLFEVPSLTQLAEMKGSGHFGVFFAFFPDGKTLASTDCPLIRFWKIPTGTPIGNISVPGLTIIAVSPDGRTIASTSCDSYIKLFNVSTGLEILKKRLSNDLLAFSPDGTKLAVINHAMIIILDARHLEEYLRLKGHRRRINSLAFSPDGKTLATCSRNGTIRFWNVSTGQVIFNLKAHKPVVLCVAFSPDGKMLASTGADGTVKIWNVENGTLLKEITVLRKEIPCVAFSQDMQFMAASASKGELYLWKLI